MHYDGEALLTARLPQLAARARFYSPDHDLFSEAFPVRLQLDPFQRRFGGTSVDDALDLVGLAGLGGSILQRSREASSVARK